MRTLLAPLLVPLLVGVLAVPGQPAEAQDNPVQGIGFAQAEEGTFLCRHENVADALSCAQEQCAEQAVGQECAPTAWCFPAKWSGTMVVWLEDFHTTQVLCGAPSEASLTEAMRALCVGAETAAKCDLVTVIDPEGNERAVEGVSFEGIAANPAPGSPAPDGVVPVPDATGGAQADPASVPLEPATKP